ncbi:Uncharacterised protein [Dorea longicatena]|nr:Uncharacterised protein [Dorea longicatena]
MIQIQCKETLYTYNLYHITKAFFPNAEIKQCVDAEQEPLDRQKHFYRKCIACQRRKQGWLLILHAERRHCLANWII